MLPLPEQYRRNSHFVVDTMRIPAHPNPLPRSHRHTAKVRESDQALIKKLTVADYSGKPERAFIIHVDTWDRNCPQHIIPRYT